MTNEEIAAELTSLKLMLLKIANHIGVNLTDTEYDDSSWDDSWD